MLQDQNLFRLKNTNIKALKNELPLNFNKKFKFKNWNIRFLRIVLQERKNPFSWYIIYLDWFGKQSVLEKVI